MQNKSLSILFLALLFYFGRGNSIYAQNQTLFIDDKASEVSFKVKHLGVLNVKGQFSKFSGTIHYREGKLTQLESAIKVNSVNTDDKSRDETLLSSAYLDVKTFPVISFSSTAITSHQIIGLLKIKNVEQEITMPYELSEDSVLIISTDISREDFKLDFGSMDSLIGDRIEVKLRIVAQKTK